MVNILPTYGDFELFEVVNYLHNVYLYVYIYIYNFYYEK